MNFTFIGQCRKCFVHQREMNFKRVFSKSSDKRHVNIKITQCKKCAGGNSMFRKRVCAHLMHNSKTGKLAKIHVKRDFEKLIYSKTGIMLCLCNGCQELCAAVKAKNGYAMMSICSDCAKFNKELQTSYFTSFRANDWKSRNSR